MKFPIVWASDTLPDPEDVTNYVFPDLRELFKGLDKAEDLMFHTIYIGDMNEDGPIVMAYGKEGDKNIYLNYIPEVEWFTI